MHPHTCGGSVPSATDHLENVVVQCTDAQPSGERLRAGAYVRDRGS